MEVRLDLHDRRLEISLFFLTLSDIQTSMSGCCSFSVCVSIDLYVFGLAQFVTEKIGLCRFPDVSSFKSIPMYRV